MEDKKKDEETFSPKKITVLGRELPVYYSQTKSKVTENFRDLDDGLSVDFIQVPLICVYTHKRIEVPCRTHQCKHIQCFDASALFQLREKLVERDGRSICPICGAVANVYIDGYIRSVLQQTSSDKDVQIFSDCTWAGCKDPDESKTEKNDSDDVIDLTNDTIIDLTELDITIDEIDKTL